MPSANRKTTRKRSKKGPSDSEMLEEVLLMFHQKIHEQFKDDDFKPKVADFLKVLEMKYKLKLTGDGKEKILEIIEKLRKAELGAQEASDAPAD
jgi:DNA-directed RNA polymerase subunit F